MSRGLAATETGAIPTRESRGDLKTFRVTKTAAKARRASLTANRAAGMVKKSRSFGFISSTPFSESVVNSIPGISQVRSASMGSTERIKNSNTAG